MDYRTMKNIVKMFKKMDKNEIIFMDTEDGKTYYLKHTKNWIKVIDFETHDWIWRDINADTLAAYLIGLGVKTVTIY